MNAEGTPGALATRRYAELPKITVTRQIVIRGEDKSLTPLPEHYAVVR